MSLESPSPRTGVTVDGARALARLAKSAEIALATVDLSLPQYRVLIFLSDHEAAAASALASRLDVTRPTITALVDGLVARGWVQRHPASGDRRRVEHHLTASGEAALAAADHAVIDRLDRVAGHIDHDRRAMAHSLEQWGEGLNRARRAYWSEAASPTDPGPDVDAAPTTGDR